MALNDLLYRYCTCCFNPTRDIADECLYPYRNMLTPVIQTADGVEVADIVIENTQEDIQQPQVHAVSWDEHLHTPVDLQDIDEVHTVVKRPDDIPQAETEELKEGDLKTPGAVDNQIGNKELGTKNEAKNVDQKKRENGNQKNSKDILDKKSEQAQGDKHDGINSNEDIEKVDDNIKSKKEVIDNNRNRNKYDSSEHQNYSTSDGGKDKEKEKFTHDAYYTSSL
jgi:hypothetical protein